MTVKNEAHVLDRLAADVRAQTVKPDEIVVTDGGSTDGTVERLREALDEFEDVRVISMPGANIAAGRNRAIAEARGEVVLVVGPGAPIKSEAPVLAGPDLKAIAAALAERWGCSKREAYQRLLEMER